MPQRISKILAACATNFIDHRRGRADSDFHPPIPQPRAEVYVFVIEEVPFVESPKRPQGFSSEEHEHPGHPIRVVDGFSIRRDDTWTMAERLGGQGEGARKRPRMVFWREIRRGCGRQADRVVIPPW